MFVCFYIIFLFYLFLNTCNALMYVSLSIESNFNNVSNDIDVVCKSILLMSSKILLKGLKFHWEWLNNLCFFHRRPWKIELTNDLIFLPTSNFVIMCLSFTKIGC